MPDPAACPRPPIRPGRDRSEALRATEPASESSIEFAELWYIRRISAGRHAFTPRRPGWNISGPEFYAPASR